MEIVSDRTPRSVEDVRCEDCEEADDPTVAESRSENAGTDEYSYTQRDNFTSEIFKIEVANLPFHMSPKDFKKLLTGRLRLQPHKIKMFNIKRARFAFVTFKNDQLRDDAIKALDGYHHKQNTFRAELAKPRADPVQRARKQRSHLLTGESNPGTQSVLDVVIPWHGDPYDEQLRRKQSSIEEVLIKLERDLSRQQSKDFNDFVRALKEDTGRKTICDVADICGSPRENFYRNKNEFTPGHDETGRLVLGFRKSSYKRGSTEVGRVCDGMKHIPKRALEVAELFEQYFLQCAEARPPYDAQDERGYWRQVTVRTSETDQCMVIVLMHPQDLTIEEVEQEVSKLRTYYDSSLSGVVSSLYFQRFDKKSNVYPLEHVAGSEVITEELLGIRFEISPPSFFQVNTKAAEILYGRIFELAELAADSTVLDLFCGIGSIGLTMASKVKRVIGAEIIPDAVDNARRVASQHGINNCEFIAGKAEDVLSLALHKVSDEKKVVAILDPPRQGVHKRVIKLLRSSENISCIVYVACNPAAAMPNIIDFCKQSSNNYRGGPWFPCVAQAVDMFPHTPHTELIVVLRRFKDVVLSSRARGEADSVS
ncbi:tRNA (uracil-5-)-methyltransferase homolog A [Galendromus occidentalis]|uniref:tRNA (uracil(54)-C(5))-methyltransferase n=1 Tax=Galendromus occidentalis TaxID=34638 RepID=A0AAJ6QM28_9ACAR|nr:tRNA (uracil-5-)-methyltransferase homolog A [Galendromus occidentalis]